MNKFVRFLLICCLVAKTISATASEDHQYSESDEKKIISTPSADEQGSVKEPAAEKEEIERENVGRSIAGHNVQQDVAATADKDHHHAEFKKRAKPFKHIFMGIYKNYKSTYLGNRTLLDYKNTLRERIAATKHAINLKPSSDSAAANDDANEEIEVTTVAEEVEPSREEVDDDELNVAEIASDEFSHNDAAEVLDDSEEENSNAAPSENKPAVFSETDADVSADPATLAEFVMESYLENRHKKRRKRRRNHTRKITKKSKPAKITPPAGGDDPLVYAGDKEYRYSVGPGMNMSLNMNDYLVSVNLDGDTLRELITSRWLSDNSAQGRGRKYDMISKFLPLFILPFLIQSAIVPFLVTKLKLLLMKSILVGKLAIFLLIISAIKNGNKSMQSYEVAPSYWAGEPSRRSEMAALASSAAYNGYRVEGKPTTWIN